MVDIELGEDQSAEPDKCGSCRFFRHRQDKYDTMGICSVKLPPWSLVRGDFPSDMNNEVDPRTVSDTDTCVLHQTNNGVTFVQVRKWHAGKPSN